MNKNYIRTAAGRYGILHYCYNTWEFNNAKTKEQVIEALHQAVDDLRYAKIHK